MAIALTSGVASTTAGVTTRNIRATIDAVLVEASVGAVLLTTDFNYVLLAAAGIYVDPDTKNQVLQSSMAVSELTVIATSKSFFDIVSLNDATLLTTTKVIPELITLAEALAITTQYSLADIGLLSDETATHLTKPVTSTALALSDERATHFTKSITDALAITESFFNIGFWVTRNLSDAAVISDAVTLVNAEALADQTGVSDTSIATLAKPLGDGVGLADVVTINSGYGRIFTDSLACSDALGITTQMELSDSLLLLESTVFSGSAIQLTAPINTFSFNSIPINGELRGSPLYDITVLGDVLTISFTSGSVLARAPFNTTLLG